MSHRKQFFLTDIKIVVAPNKMIIVGGIVFEVRLSGGLNANSTISWTVALDILNLPRSQLPHVSDGDGNITRLIMLMGRFRE